MVSVDDIYAAYRCAKKNKGRTADAIEYELHLESNLLRLVDDINNRTLQPTAYTFVATRPKPREIFATDMSTRIVHHYLDIRLRPLIEAELTDRTYNNRIGFGPDNAFNQLVTDIYEVTEGHTRKAWVISADISGYFPHANQDEAFSQLKDLVMRKYHGDDRDDVLYMLRSCIFSYPCDHCTRKSPLHMWQLIPEGKSLFRTEDGFGAAIGYLIWQNEMNYYLNDFDHFMIDTCGFHYLRFVDDMRWVIPDENKDAFLAMFPMFREMLARKGCKFNEIKFECQPAERGGVFIGRAYKGRRVYASTRIVRHFAQQMKKIEGRARQSKIDVTLSSLNSYTGILKGTCGYNVIRKVGVLPDDWRKFLTFDKRRLCFVAKDKYSFRRRLARKYDLRLKK